MEKRKVETNEALADKRIEQAAHDIVVACELVRDLCTQARRPPRSLKTKRHRQLKAAISAQFHAEGILSPHVAQRVPGLYLAKDLSAMRTDPLYKAVVAFVKSKVDECEFDVDAVIECFERPDRWALELRQFLDSREAPSGLARDINADGSRGE